MGPVSDHDPDQPEVIARVERLASLADRRWALLPQAADAELPTAYGPIEVRRLTTVLKTRREPVTYWLTIGDEVIRDRMQKRLAAIRLAFTGQIPDGLLFRVSSIDDDSARAFAMQQRFAADMMSAVSADTRRKLSGLATPASAS